MKHQKRPQLIQRKAGRKGGKMNKEWMHHKENTQ